jgi:hypothetical protein
MHFPHRIKTKILKWHQINQRYYFEHPKDCQRKCWVISKEEKENLIRLIKIIGWYSYKNKLILKGKWGFLKIKCLITRKDQWS